MAPAIGPSTVLAAIALALAGLAFDARPAEGQPEPMLDRPPVGVHISSRLWALSQPSAAGSSLRQRATALAVPEGGAGSLLQPTDSSVTIEVRPSGTVNAAAATISALGGKVIHESTRYRTVTAVLPVSAIRELSAAPEIAYAEEVLRPETGGVAATNSPTAAAASLCGAARSEGDTQLNAAAVRDEYDVDGSGVVVGVLSDSFDTSGNADNAALDVSTGDLPGTGNPCGYSTPVTVIQDYTSVNGTSDEGRGMLQIIHDLAPGAGLQFATAFSGITSFADNIRSLRSAGSDVIVDDVFYYMEPFFQSGPIDAAIDDVTALGAPYFTLAGNHNRMLGGRNVGSWETPQYRAGPCPGTVAGRGLADCLDFDPGVGVDTQREFTLAGGGEAKLDVQWAEPWYGVATDFDVFVVNDNGTVVAISNYDNPGGLQRPFEWVYVRNQTPYPATFHVVIGRYSGSATPRMKTIFLQGTYWLTSLEYSDSSLGDIVGPSIYGHSGTSSGISVAAVPYNDATTPETFTSRGPMVKYFGTVLANIPAEPLAAPLVVAKPDVGATDGGASTFFGSVYAGVHRFYGTSAAGPHAAAVAALLLQHRPTLSPEQVRIALTTTATKLPNGTTESVGSGLVNALNAMAWISPPPAPSISGATAGNGRITLAYSSGPYVTDTTAACTSSDGGAAGNSSGSSTGATVAGLTNGHAYSCTVTSGNANGSATSGSIDVALPDIEAPTIHVAALPNAVLSLPLVAWSASDDIGVDRFTIQVRTGAGGARLSGWQDRPNLGKDASSYLPSGIPRGPFCVRVRAVDRAGNVSAGTAQCSSLALDDRALTASSNWRRVTRASSYAGTISTSKLVGVTLTRTHVYGSGLTLIAEKANRAGVVGVYINGRLRARVSLAAPSTKVRQRIPISGIPLLTNATVTLKVLTAGSGVSIDGLAVRVA